MIIQCPECSSQFVVPDNAIPEKGRKVRCTSCRFVWFATPEAEITPEDDESVSPNAATQNDGTEDTKEETPSVEKDLSDSDAPAAPFDSELLSAINELPDNPEDLSPSSDEEERTSEILTAVAEDELIRNTIHDAPSRHSNLSDLGRYFALGLGFIIILTYIVLPHTVAHTPELLPLASALNKLPVIDGKNLTFDAVTFSYTSSDTQPELTVEGRIENPSSTTEIIPDLVVSIWDKENSLITEERFGAPDVQLASGNSTIFSYTIDWQQFAGKSPGRAYIVFDAPEFLMR